MGQDEDRRARTLRDLEPIVRRARSFSGWSFEDVAARPLDPPPPWDYEALARDAASRARSILDLGTGGGEVLERVLRGLSVSAVATEEWEVNAPVAQRRLGPLGARVVRCSALALPFRDASFDLVLDRHEELSPREVARVLAPGGRLVTQQCGPDDWAEIWRFFHEATRFPDHYQIYQDDLRAAGLSVGAQRHYRRVAYETLGDLAYMLLLSPWWLPDFDPRRDVDRLLALEDALGTPEGIVVTESRYLIVADKPR